MGFERNPADYAERWGKWSIRCDWENCHNREDLLFTTDIPQTRKNSEAEARLFRWKRITVPSGAKIWVCPDCHEHWRLNKRMYRYMYAFMVAGDNAKPVAPLL